MLPLHRYFHRELFFQGNEPSYTGSAELIKSPAYEWQHSLGDIVTALAMVGLSIEFLHEFPVSYHQAFPNMNQGDDGGWRFPEQNDSFPQLFSIRATK